MEESRSLEPKLRRNRPLRLNQALPPKARRRRTPRPRLKKRLGGLYRRIIKDPSRNSNTSSGTLPRALITHGTISFARTRRPRRFRPAQAKHREGGTRMRSFYPARSSPLSLVVVIICIRMWHPISSTRKCKAGRYSSRRYSPKRSTMDIHSWLIEEAQEVLSSLGAKAGLTLPEPEAYFDTCTWADGIGKSQITFSHPLWEGVPPLSILDAQDKLALPEDL